MILKQIFVESRRPRAGWRIALGFIAMMTAIGVLAAAVDAIEVPFVESFLWQLLAAPVLVAVAKLLSRMDRRPFGAYGLAWEPRRLLLGAFLGAGFVVLVWALLLALGWVAVTGRLHNQYAVPFAAGWIGFALRYGSVAVFEELFHRGFLITNLAEGLGGPVGRRGLACVVAAVLFGALHLTNDDATLLAAVNVTLLGIVFGLAYIATGTLSLSIGMHFAWNFALGPCLGLPVSGYAPRVSLLFCDVTGPQSWTGGAFGPEGGLMATLVLVAALAVALAAYRLCKSRDADAGTDGSTHPSALSSQPR